MSERKDFQSLLDGVADARGSSGEPKESPSSSVWSSVTSWWSTGAQEEEEEAHEEEEEVIHDPSLSDALAAGASLLWGGLNSVQTRLESGLKDIGDALAQQLLLEEQQLEGEVAKEALEAQVRRLVGSFVTPMSSSDVDEQQQQLSASALSALAHDMHYDLQAHVKALPTTERVAIHEWFADAKDMSDFGREWERAEAGAREGAPSTTEHDLGPDLERLSQELAEALEGGGGVEHTCEAVCGAVRDTVVRCLCVSVERMHEVLMACCERIVLDCGDCESGVWANEVAAAVGEVAVCARQAITCARQCFSMSSDFFQMAHQMVLEHDPSAAPEAEQRLERLRSLCMMDCGSVEALMTSNAFRDVVTAFTKWALVLPPITRPSGPLSSALQRAQRRQGGAGAAVDAQVHQEEHVADDHQLDDESDDEDLTDIEDE